MTERCVACNTATSVLFTPLRCDDGMCKKYDKKVSMLSVYTNVSCVFVNTPSFGVFLKVLYFRIL